MTVAWTALAIIAAAVLLPVAGVFGWNGWITCRRWARRRRRASAVIITRIVAP